MSNMTYRVEFLYGVPFGEPEWRQSNYVGSRYKTKKEAEKAVRFAMSLSQRPREFYRIVSNCPEAEVPGEVIHVLPMGH
jgi:hypothetical protein